jgi:hypothetical protein
MRTFFKTCLGISCFALAAVSSARADSVLVTVPLAPGSIANGTNPFGINDAGTIVGSFTMSDGSEHGFFGPISGAYTVFDVPGGGPGTEPRAIDNTGRITGSMNTNNADQSILEYGEFERYTNGTFLTVMQGTTPLNGILQGINTGHAGMFVGEYWTFDSVNNRFIRHGYSGRAGQWVADIVLPFNTIRTAPRSINGPGTVVGFFTSGGANHGFILQKNVATQFDYPDPSNIGTVFEGINDTGVVSGSWTDTAGNQHSFTLDTKSNTLTPISVPGATTVTAWGINSAGLVALTTDIGSFIYCPHSVGQCTHGTNAVVIASVSFKVSQGSVHSVACTAGCVANRVSIAALPHTNHVGLVTPQTKRGVWSKQP